jgi:hypothetical protein
MKKIVWAGVVLIVIGAVGMFTVHSSRAQAESPGPAGTTRVSRKAAQSLQTKIDHIKRNGETPDPKRSAVETEVTESELESYVVYSMKEDIPVQVDSINVHLTPGTVAADTQVTFTSNATGNSMLDALVGGTHNLSVKGHLSGAEGVGKFDLEEVKVDGIPVPKVLIQTLVEKYVKPKYPEVDLKAPFDMPWGIRVIDIGEGKARIVY